MKTPDNSLTKDWTFKRSLRVSIKFALIYAIGSLIWIWVFGLKDEIIMNLKLTSEISKTIPLSLNSWENLLLNFLGIIIFGISLFGILKFTDGGIGRKAIDKGRLFFVLIIGFIVGLFYSFFPGLDLVFSVGLLVGIMTGLLLGYFYGITFSLSSAFSFTLVFALKSGLGLGLSLILGFLSGLSFVIILALILGIIHIIIQLFFKKTWAIIGKGILWIWKTLIK